MANTYGFPSGTVDSGKVVTGGVDGDWDGSMERALEVASFARECTGKSNPISSQKRTRETTASGNVSDHYEGNLSSYAVDIPASGEVGDELLSCIMSKFNGGSNSDYKGGKWLNVNIDGYRYQFGWKVKDHFDHIHIGVKKINPKIKKTKKPDTSDAGLAATLLGIANDYMVKPTIDNIGSVLGKSEFLKVLRDIGRDVETKYEKLTPKQKEMWEQNEKLKKLVKKIL